MPASFNSLYICPQVCISEFVLRTTLTDLHGDLDYECCVHSTYWFNNLERRLLSIWPNLHEMLLRLEGLRHCCHCNWIGSHLLLPNSNYKGTPRLFSGCCSAMGLWVWMSSLSQTYRSNEVARLPSSTQECLWTVQQFVHPSFVVSPISCALSSLNVVWVREVLFGFGVIPTRHILFPSDVQGCNWQFEVADDHKRHSCHTDCQSAPS